MSRILIAANLDVGLYKFRRDLILELKKRGHEVFLSLPDGDLIEPLKAMGCTFLDTPVDRRGINPVTDGKLFLQYGKLLSKVRPDLVITYTIKPNIYCGLACRLKKIPYAVNITGLGTAFQKEGLVKKLVCFLYRLACKKAHTIFFENAGNRQTFLEHRLVRENQTCLLPGAGINLEEYKETEYPPCEQETLHFLFIGRVMKEKGIEELFQVARNIKKKYPAVIFAIVGPYEDDYKKQVEELEQEGVIRFFGYQEDVKPFLAECHCFVLPSYHEGMANTLLEAGAMGRPLITSRIHGCMEAVEEGKNGFLVKPQDAKDLEEKIEQFIHLPEEEKKQLGKYSRKIMEEKFEKGKVVGKTVERLGRLRE